MKRLFATIMLFLFLLNVLGYYGVLMGIRVRTGIELTDRLNANEDTVGPTITFRVPLTLPYGVDSRNYERVDGEFVHQGEVLRLVKHRMLQDTLYIVCVKDEKSTHVDKALEDFVKSFTHNPDQSQQGKSIPSFIKDYVFTRVMLTSSVPGWEHVIVQASKPQQFFSSFFSSVIHPPERG